VLDAESGYCGGWTDDPTYRQVCAGSTGHAEVVRVVFDPSVVSFEELTRRFWKMHSPFRSHMVDPHSQYRSAIYTTTDAQMAHVLAEKERMEAGGRTLSTDIRPAPTFWRAEEYHQRYYEKMGLSSCRL
jgi:peptide-methionine (S)-S-oxide reductase